MCIVAAPRLLLSACQKDASLDEYQAAIVEANVLLKRMVATRRAGHSWTHLNLTSLFARWMAQHEYRDAYFLIVPITAVEGN